MNPFLLSQNVTCNGFAFLGILSYDTTATINTNNDSNNEQVARGLSSHL